MKKGMANMEKIYELLDLLQTAVSELPGDNIRLSISTEKDGYQSISVTEHDNKAEIESGRRKYRNIITRYRFGGEWSTDTSKMHNDYLAENGLLLGGADDDRA
jgi:hypothetical protein